MFAIVLSLLAGCASENSCERYVNAAYSCTEEAGGDPAAYDAETVCGSWNATAEAAYGEWYTCQAEAWENADCSTAEGTSAAATAAQECPAA